MTAAWLWARADIRRRWASLIVVAAICALAVGATLALAAGARRADSAADRYAQSIDLPAVLASSENGPALAAMLRSDPRISRFEWSEAMVIAPAPIEPGPSGFTAFARLGPATAGFGRPPLIAGRYLDEPADDEIMVNERSAVANGFHVGQRVEMRSATCPAGCPEPIGEATIVGIVRLPTDLTNDPSLPAVTFASNGFRLGQPSDLPKYAAWFGIYTRDPNDAVAVAADLSVRIDDGDVVTSRSTLAVLDRSGRLQRNALAVAAAVVALAGLVVTSQAVARHLVGRIDDALLLGAIGLRRRERQAGAVLSVLPAIGAGSVAGVLVAVCASPLLPLGLTRRTDPDIGLHADGLTLVLGVAVAAVLLGLATVIAARQWTRPPPSVATVGRGSLPTRLTSALGLSPVAATGIQFALERPRGRARLPVAATIAALAGVTAVVMGALVVRSSLDGLAASPARFGQDSDLLVSLQDADLRAEASRLTTDARVADVAIARNGELNIARRDGTAVQIATVGTAEVSGRIPVTAVTGRVPAGANEIALEGATMGALGLRLGDRVTLSGPCGHVDAEVVGRIIVPLTGTNYPDEGSVVPLETFEALCSADLLAAFDVHDTALVRLHDPTQAAAVRADWEASGLAVADRPIPVSVAAMSDVRPVPIVVGALVVALGAAAGAHALMLGVRHRRRDLAVLRTLGLRPSQTGNIVRWHAATLAIAALVVGVPLGLLLGRAGWSAIAGPSNVVVRVDVNALGLISLVAGVIALAAVLSVWPSRRAVRLRPAAALRSE